MITVFNTPCGRPDGGLVVTVTGTGGTVAAVVAVPADKIPGIAVLTIALITSSRPRLGHVRTERGQEDTDDQDDRRGQQTYPTLAEVVTTGRRSHVSRQSRQSCSTIERCCAGVHSQSDLRNTSSRHRRAAEVALAERRHFKGRREA